MNKSNSKEVQELFFALGYGFFSGKNKVVEDFEYTDGFYFFAYGSDCDLTVSSDHNLYLAKNDFKELTLPQLRGLVVLHRNDVKDATHTDGERKGFLSSDGVEYFWNAYDLEWFKAKQMTFAYEKFKPIQEQGLISGAEALRALADGKEVERKLGIGWCDDVKKLSAETILHGVSELRIKPQTIKLELEIPVCGTNYKHGQLIWILNSLEPKEYCSVILDESDELPAYWWETEEEIKQVVAALRGGIKG